MIEEAVRMVKAEMASISFASLPGPDAARLVGSFGELRRLAESGLTLAAGRVEATDKTSLSGTGCSSTKDLLSSAAGISSREADGLLDLASRLNDLSATKDLFSEGILSAAEAAEIAKAADRNAAAEASLLDTAQDPDKSFKDLSDQARRVQDPSPDADAKKAAHARAKRNIKTWTDEWGLGHLKASGPPGAIAAMLARITAEKEARFRAGVQDGQRPNAAHLLFDSAYDLVMAGDSGTGTGLAPPAFRAKASPARVDLMIIVHWDALVRGVTHPGELCEIPGIGPIPVENARGHLGDAALKFIIAQGQDVTTVAHLGRRRGSHLRTALGAMFGCCIDCGRTMGLEWDHLEPWAKGGPTSFDNMRPRCRVCHRAKTRTDYPEGTTGYRRAQAGAAESVRRRATRGGGAAGGGAKGGGAGGRAKGGGVKGGGVKGAAKVNPPRRT